MIGFEIEASEKGVDLGELLSPINQAVGLNRLLQETPEEKKKRLDEGLVVETAQEVWA